MISSVKIFNIVVYTAQAQTLGVFVTMKLELILASIAFFWVSCSTAYSILLQFKPDK